MILPPCEVGPGNVNLNNIKGEYNRIYTNLFQGNDYCLSLEASEFMQNSYILESDNREYKDILASELNGRYLGFKVL